MKLLRNTLRKLSEPLNKYVNRRIETKLVKLTPRTELRFEVHLAEHCNLNCKGCDNFSPLAREEYLDIEEYESDCKRLSVLFDGKVERLQLLGENPYCIPA